MAGRGPGGRVDNVSAERAPLGARTGAMAPKDPGSTRPRRNDALTVRGVLGIPRIWVYTPALQH